MTRPSSSTARTAGLPMSCSSTAHDDRHERRDAGQAGLVGRRRMPDAAELLDDAADVGQRLERVLEDVEVVVRVLLDAAQAVELGQDDGEGAPARRGRGRPAARVVGGRAAPRARRAARSPLTPASAGAARSAGRRWRPRRARGRSPRARRARRSDAQRVVVERRGRAEAQAARGEVVEAAQRVDELAAVERPGHRVDGEVARAQVGLDAALRVAGSGGPAAGAAAAARAAGRRRRARRRRTIRQVPKRVRRGEDGAAEPVGEAARERPRRRRRRRCRRRSDGQTEQLVAQAAADEPARSPAAERGAGRRRDLVGRRRRRAACARPLTVDVRPRGRRRGSGAPPAAPRRRRSRS